MVSAVECGCEASWPASDLVTITPPRRPKPVLEPRYRLNDEPGSGDQGAVRAAGFGEVLRGVSFAPER